MKKTELALYRDLLGDIKTRVRQAQHRAALSAISAAACGKNGSATCDTIAACGE